MNKTFLLLMLAGAARAQVDFEHGDWQLICDNTHTCRAAGYQFEGEMPISVLLTREAGANAAVRGALTWQTADDQSAPAELTFTLDGKDLGPIKAEEEGSGELNSGELNEKQVAALIKALQAEKTSIKFSGDKREWELSADGAAAVLLKMDEVQGRIDTASALTEKRQGTGQVSVKAEAKPVIRVVKLAKTEASTIDDAAEQQRLRALLDPRKQCMINDPKIKDVYSSQFQLYDKKPQVWQLDDKHKLVAVLCDFSPYNPPTYLFGLFDHQLAKLQQSLGSDEEPLNEFNEDDTINGTMKSRNLEDCYHSIDYRWNGEKFVKTSEWDSGLCRGFLGGAWEMPLFVSEVQEAK